MSEGFSKNGSWRQIQRYFSDTCDDIDFEGRHAIARWWGYNKKLFAEQKRPM